MPTQFCPLHSFHFIQHRGSLTSTVTLNTWIAQPFYHRSPFFPLQAGVPDQSHGSIAVSQRLKGDGSVRETLFLHAMHGRSSFKRWCFELQMPITLVARVHRPVFNSRNRNRTKQNNINASQAACNIVLPEPTVWAEVDDHFPPAFLDFAYRLPCYRSKSFKIQESLG